MAVAVAAQGIFSHVSTTLSASSVSLTPGDNSLLVAASYFEYSGTDFDETDPLVRPNTFAGYPWSDVGAGSSGDGETRRGVKLSYCPIRVGATGTLSFPAPSFPGGTIDVQGCYYWLLSGAKATSPFVGTTPPGFPIDLPEYRSPFTVPTNPATATGSLIIGMQVAQSETTVSGSITGTGIVTTWKSTSLAYRSTGAYTATTTTTAGVAPTITLSYSGGNASWMGRYWEILPQVGAYPFTGWGQPL